MIRRVHHCAHWGAHVLLVEDDRIVGIEPFGDDPAPSPMLQSTRHWLDPDRRILAPMVRRDWLRRRDGSDRTLRGREGFVEVTWDEAEALVAGEIIRVRDTFGPEAIFAGSYGWASPGRFHHAPTQLHRMLNAAGGYTAHRDSYSFAAGPVILRHVLGEDGAITGRATTWQNIAETTEILVVFGGLSPRTSQVEAGGLDRHRVEGHLRRIAARGVRVVLVSPARDDLPADIPAEWWPIRPNTDTALMLALAGEIHAAGAQSDGFLERHCSGTARFLDYLTGASDRTAKTADWAAAITGIPADAIRALAQALPGQRSMLTVSWSLQRARHGEQPYWAALALACLIGQIGLPGGGVAYGHASTGGAGTVIGRGLAPAPDQLRQLSDSYIPVARIADALLTPGGTYSYAGQTRQYPDLRLVYWAGGNPFHHHQDLNRLNRAWARPETVIVQDPVWTATAQRADIVLPATSTLERNDIAGTSRIRYLLAMQKAVRPLGRSRSDYDICRGIADRLQVEPRFSEGRNEMGWLRHLYAQSAADALANHGLAMPDFDSFWARGHTEIPFVTDHVYLQDFRTDPETHPLRTETGRILLSSRLLAERDLADCPPHPAWILPEEWLGGAGPAGSLHLLSRQPAQRLHSQLDYAPASAGARDHGPETLMLNPDDARARAIAAGDQVLVWNARGRCLARAQPDAGLRPGVAVLPTGAWLTLQSDGTDTVDLAGNPNVLTHDRPASEFSQGCAANSCLVQVRRYSPVPETAQDA